MVLGIDPGLERTGYGVLEIRGNKELLVDAGLLRTKRSHDLPRRLAELRRSLEDLLQDYEKALLFYQLAGKRDEIMTLNTLQAIGNAGISPGFSL